MKILHESHSQLRLKQTPGWGIAVFMVIWGCLFAGMPLAVITALTRDLGVIQLRCDRPEPSLVRCESQRSAFFGLVQRPAQTYSNVTAAQQQTQTGRDDEGDVTYDYWVTVTTHQGEQTLVEDNIRINGVKGNLAEMDAIAQRINSFLSQTHQPSLTFEIDNRWRLSNLGFLAFLSLFPTFGAFAFYFIFQTEELIFDRELGQLQRNRQTLLGPRRQALPLHSITGLDIETVDGDDSTTYQLKLLPQTLGRRPLMTSLRRDQVTQVQQKIQQFLGLP